MADTLLRLILDLLDRIESPAVLESDIGDYPPREFDDLLAAGILQKAGRAERIPRPARFGPGPELVVRETARGLFGVADEGDYFEPVALAEGDVGQYEISLLKFVDRVRRENGISGNGFENSAGLIPLGTKRLSETVWAYLSLPNGDEGAILARGARLHAPGVRQNALIVVPNGPAFSPEARRVLGEICVLSLWEAAGRGTLALDWTSVLTSGRLINTTTARVFRLEGQFWTLTFNGKTVRLREAKGLSYICQLLRRPGRLIPAVELIVDGGSPSSSSAVLGSTGEILDDTAISQYRDRLADLELEIAQADKRNDLGRKEASENEREQIRSQIRSATGLGGRRRSNDDGEKIRKAVSINIGRAIQSIRRHHRPLADHFQRSINRGHDLLYTGDGIPWEF